MPSFGTPTSAAIRSVSSGWSRTHSFGADFGRSVVNFWGPMVFCVISRYHGGAFVVFSAPMTCPRDGAWHRLRIRDLEGPPPEGWWRENGQSVISVAGASVPTPPSPPWWEPPRDSRRGAD